MFVQCTRVFMIVAALCCLVFLLPQPGISKEKKANFYEELGKTTSIEDRIPMLEAQIAKLEREHDQVNADVKQLIGILESGLADKKGLEEAANKVFKREEKIYDLIEWYEEKLQHYKKLMKPEYAEARKMEEQIIALEAEDRRLRDLNKRGRITGTMLPVDADTNVRQMRVLLNKRVEIRIAQRRSMSKTDREIKASQKKSEGSGGGNQCFVAGTLVLMADGSFKPIELVEVGEEVLTRDVHFGEITVSEVYELLNGTVDSVFVFDSGLQANSAHKFYTTEGTRSAGELQPGMTLVGLDGPVPLASIERKGPVVASTDTGSLPVLRVYNIMVRGTHTYFVSPDGYTTYQVLDISACGR